MPPDAPIAYPPATSGTPAHRSGRSLRPGLNPTIQGQGARAETPSLRAGVSALARRATLAAVLATAVTLPFGQSVTGVQLERIGAELGGSAGQLQWIANAYNLSFAALLLTSGSLADLVGRRRVFVGATMVFLLGSLFSALAPNLLLLDLARFISGAGAAAQLASAPALLAFSFSRPGPERARAFGLLGSGFGTGLALGPVVGGWLVVGPGWRWAFLLVVPFALSALLAARWIPESRERDVGDVRRRFDRLGAILFMAALLMLMVCLDRAVGLGWSSFTALALLACSLGLSAAWAWVEHRADAPMLDLAVLGNRAFAGAALAWAAVAFGFVALLIIVPFHLQAVRGVTALGAGLALLPMTIPLLLVPTLAPRLARAVGGTARLVPAGVALVALGDLELSWAGGGDGGAFSWMSLGLFLVGVGAGSINGLLDNIAMSVIPPERAGMAAGGFQTMRVLGDAVGIAVAGSLLGTFSGAAPAAAAAEAGFGLLMLVLAGITLLGALASGMLLRQVRS